MIFVNFKAYEESSGDNTLKLIRILEEVASQTSVQIIPVVQVVDIARVVPATKLPVWVQHVDAVGFGAHTGSVLPLEVRNLGAAGTFLNHSEHKIADAGVLKESVVSAHAAGLQTLVFTADTTELQSALLYKPHFVSYEPPELVGSTSISVSEAKPEIIKQAADISISANIPLIVGAGIHSAKDVSVAISLGAKGIAVATNIVKAVDPKESLLELLTGFS